MLGSLPQQPRMPIMGARPGMMQRAGMNMGANNNTPPIDGGYNWNTRSFTPPQSAPPHNPVDGGYNWGNRSFPSPQPHAPNVNGLNLNGQIMGAQIMPPMLHTPPASPEAQAPNPLQQAAQMNQARQALIQLHLAQAVQRMSAHATYHGNRGGR